MNDEAFRRYQRHQYNAYLGYYSNFWGYLRSYQNAFQALIDNVYDTKLHVDNLSYPILFIARHCLELGFKANIRHFLKYSQKEDFKKGATHDLEKLFGAFKLHVKSTVENLKSKYGIEVEQGDIDSFDDYCAKVDELTSILHQLDQFSDSFRYPVNKEDIKHFEHTDTINLLDVKQLLDSSMILLIHTSDVFAKYTEYAIEIEKIYEEEMNSIHGFQ